MDQSKNVDNHIHAELQKEQNSGKRRASVGSHNSQTAREFIDSQLRLEADAREVLPYSFDSCTQPLGPLRQSLFACMTCNPPPTNPDEPHTSAGVCYSCSISCHGEHTLVELFTKRNFVCDCGTTRLPTGVPCTLRDDPKTGKKGVSSQEPAAGNSYSHNFQNKFCGCGEDYNADEEKGTMFQCLGLGTVETGGCGEDWWHPECLIGLPRDWNKAANKEENNEKEGTEQKPENEVEDDETPLPPNFPGEDDFETFLCYKCVESNPWVKSYAEASGFLPPVYKSGGLTKALDQADTKPPQGQTLATIPEEEPNSKKRKADDEGDEAASKRPKDDEKKEENENTPIEPKAEPKPESTEEKPKAKHSTLPNPTPTGTFSLFLKEDFRDHLCRCPSCFPNLTSHPQLREEEETYEPPLSEAGDANGAASTGTGSLLDRGEAALSNIDRVRAIEGAMVYNHLRDKVKEFLKPFAESGKAVGAEDIKSYFEKLRGDDGHIQDAAGQAKRDGGDDGDRDDGRKEQSGY